MDVSSQTLRLQPRRSIHSKSDLTDDQKELVQNSKDTMPVTTRNKSNSQSRNQNNSDIVRTQDQVSYTENDEDEQSDSENESQDSSEFSRESSASYLGESSRQNYANTLEDNSIRNASNSKKQRISIDSARHNESPDNLKNKLKNREKIKPTTSPINLKNFGILILFVLLPGLYYVRCNTNSSVQEKIDLKVVEEEFPTQDDFLWLAFKSGVEDVLTQNKPSSFILLYEELAEKTLNQLLPKLSNYAICSITYCHNDPIILTPRQLNSPEILKDYGIIIEKYRDKLSDVGVMVIKNLEQVRGTSAQVFHAFCDEFTPLVEKSLFIFTMKVDKLPESKNQMKFLEEFFRRKWIDVKSDTLNPLITRITSMVIEVRA